jgi:peptidoglycan hydrolase-like protein with peptidoglycan-binding domain
VGVVQLLLREIVTLYGEDADLLPLDGVFGESTERAVKDFQRIQRLPEDGRVDRITWNRLVRAQMPWALNYFRE